MTTQLQKEPGTLSPSTQAAPPMNQAAIDCPSIFQTAPAPRFYGGFDYMLWWVKGAPLSVPFVSTGPISTTHHGLLGPPAENGGDSTVLYGAGHLPAQGGKDIQNMPPFSGGRLSAGLFLDDDQIFAIEGSSFLLERRGAGYQARGDANGNPILGFPVYNSVPYSIGTMTIQVGEDSLPFSLPDSSARVRQTTGVITGGVAIANHLQLWGADGVGVVRLFRTPTWRLSGLFGFKYLDLTEKFDLSSDFEGQSGFYSGQSGQLSETFQTRNHFYGGVLGLRGGYTMNRLSFDLTAKVALGDTYQVQNVWGGFQAMNFPSQGAFSGPEALFAQPANEGRRSGNRFTVVPEAQVKVAYDFRSWLQFTASYDFLYWSNVIRPTDQINREIPKGQTFNQADPQGASATSPAPIYKTTDFFAHGLSVGLNFRY